MSSWVRFVQFVRSKLHAATVRAETPMESLEFAYQERVETLSRVREDVVQMLAAKKRLELEIRTLRGTEQRYRSEALLSLRSGNEGLARTALLRADGLDVQIREMEANVDDLSSQQRQLEARTEELRASVEVFRSEKAILAARYVASRASISASEALGGFGEERRAIEGMAERAKGAVLSAQARAEALSELLARGFGDGVGPAANDEIDRRLRTAALNTRVDAEIAQLKAGTETRVLPAGDTTEG